jgi:hypothetical protein
MQSVLKRSYVSGKPIERYPLAVGPLPCTLRGCCGIRYACDHLNVVENIQIPFPERVWYVACPYPAVGGTEKSLFYADANSHFSEALHVSSNSHPVRATDVIRVSTCS